MTTEELAVKVAEVEHRAKSNTRRVDKLEQQTEAIQKLATAIEVLVNEQSHQTEAISELKSDVAIIDKKVENITNKPAKLWDSIVEKIIMVVISAMLAFLLTKLGL